ncbi:MAG: hypothetical protein M1832_001005 [Thelocarpon impressellum]|nr:MAG: hypothetical protein M1832_001005 [Thelocarpon impressellum]
MTSVDELFKHQKPSLPGNKRKFEVGRDANEIYKSTKLRASDDAKGNGRATVEDEDEGDDDVAGPEAPPDMDDVAPDDDEEGRFFGGGITNGTADILDFMDQQDGAEVQPEKIDSAWVRRLALNFERRISKNAELRAKFPDEPQKFVGSEADLDADIKALSSLAEHPELYEEFVKLGCVESLVGLLSHENTDIAIDAIEIISELTDEDVEAEQAQWDALVNAMLEADLLNLLIQNFSRLDEESESDRGGVYHALSVLENLASQIDISEKIALKTSMLPWLLGRLKAWETPVGQNKQYAAEILAILLQSSPANRKRLTELDGVDILLQLLSAYRKKDPEKGTEEEEYVANVFDCLTCVVDEAEGKRKFVEAEGVELCLIMLRQGMMSKPRALRLLDHSLAGARGGEVCESLIEAAGLKTVFGMFMKKQDNQTLEHLLGIFSAMLRCLSAKSAGRIRTLAKFVEKDYEKIARLSKLRRDYVSKVGAVDQEIKVERSNLDPEERASRESEWFSRRLDAGLYCLQTIDVILAWLVAEDDGAGERIRSLLAQTDESLKSVRATLKEQLDSMSDEGEAESQTKEMLETLVQFL